MAAAAFYWHLFRRTGRYPSVDEAAETLEAVRSDACADHNPDRLAIFLVSGTCRAQDKGVLAPRLRSLDAHLICVSVK
jgi:hypothetical protein